MPNDPPRPPLEEGAAAPTGRRRPRRRRRRDDSRRRAGPPPPVAPPPPVVPEVSRLAAAAVTSAPLSGAEVAEMKGHLDFIRTYKDVLRLKLNAAEDLLVNGQRDPSDRGVCRHLLGKIDRAVVESAIGREPLRSNAAARARMLAGAIRLTADPSVLLTYLETLPQVRSHAEAAQAFGEVVGRLDFESVSASRLGRLLQVLIETFAGHERVQVLFSLLAGPAFARAFDTALPSLLAAVVEAFAPLRAVHRRAGAAAEGARDAAALLRAGIEQLLSAPDPILRGYGEPLRVAILELALEEGTPPELADRAAGVLLASLPGGGRTYARLAIRRAAQLLDRHADDRARAVLDELRRAQPGFRLAERWRSALDARRIGRIALRGVAPEHGRLAAGFWLDAQRPVWVRTAAADAAERLAREATLQRTLALPGVAPVVADGVASGIAYVAVAGGGQPLVVDPVACRPATALAIVAAATRILHALALCDVTLPDALPERFLHTAEPTFTLLLADLDGAATSDAAAVENATVARALATRLVPTDAMARMAEPVRDALTAALDDGAPLDALAWALDVAVLRAPRE
jgi:hypothetical protein